MDFKTIVKHQKDIHKGRNARASIILKTTGNLDEGEIQDAIKKGFKVVNEMTKEQIIRKYVDSMDLLVEGIFSK